MSKQNRKINLTSCIEKIDSLSDKNLISPIVITVKKDVEFNLALDLKTLIRKNKSQMLNIDSLIQPKLQNISSNAAQNKSF